MVLIFGEIIPKAIYRDHADFIVIKSFPLLKVFHWLLRPANNLVTLLNNYIANVFKIKRLALTREDLSFLLAHSQNEDKFQKEMLEEALEFNELVAKNVMVPRTEMLAIKSDSTYDEIIEISRTNGFTRYPVYSENIDNIVGILIIYDLLHISEDKFELSSILRPPMFAPENMSISSVLQQMQKNKKSLCIVVDAYGGTSGIISMEDILEEIVGDIEDEFDTDEEVKKIHKISENSYIAFASIDIDTLNEDYEMNLPEGDYETLAGLIISKLAMIPKEGTRLTVENWDITIINATSRQIEKVKLQKNTTGKANKKK